MQEFLTKLVRTSAVILVAVVFILFFLYAVGYRFNTNMINNKNVNNVANTQNSFLSSHYPHPEYFKS